MYFIFYVYAYALFRIKPMIEKFHVAQFLDLNWFLVDTFDSSFFNNLNIYFRNTEKTPKKVLPKISVKNIEHTRF